MFERPLVTVGELRCVFALDHCVGRSYFWAFKQFTERLACTAEEYGISVEVRSEAWTSQECPQCGGTDRTIRHQDTLTCPCWFEGHAGLTAFARRDASCAPARTIRFSGRQKRS